jgi:hypothetical protein
MTKFGDGGRSVVRTGKVIKSARFQRPNVAADACPSGKQLEIIWRAQRATAVEAGDPVEAIFYGDGIPGQWRPCAAANGRFLPNRCPAGTSCPARAGGTARLGVDAGLVAGLLPPAGLGRSPRGGHGTRFRVFRRLR